MSSPSAAAIDVAAVSRARWRLGGLVVLLAFLGLALLVVVALNARSLASDIDALGGAAVPALAVVGALLIVAMVPASLIAAAAGYALGTPGGTVVALAGSSLGAVLCAMLGRYIGTPSAHLAFGERVTRAISWSDARPLRCVVMARLLPGLPFNATSYALGFTRIGLRAIAVGTAIGFAPRCFAYVALGGSLRDLNSPEARIAIAASIALAVLVAVIPRMLVRSAPSANAE